MIIDATELIVQQPSLPARASTTNMYLLKLYTYKGLIRIVPSGAVTNSILEAYQIKSSHVEVERGDSLMADRGFDILEGLAPIGIKLNISPVSLWKKNSWTPQKLVKTRSITSLRIHVERCIERIKNYHIFDGVMPLSLVDISDQIFFVLQFSWSFMSLTY